MQFLIGADPEIFLAKNGNYKSVIGLIGGDKWNPRKLSEVGHAVLEDNVAVEFNIPACDSYEAFAKEIKFTMQKIKEILPQDLEFAQASAVSFPQEELNCDAAWLFGCEPDFDAWHNGIPNIKPHADDPCLRSCGGHIHVGSDVAINNPVDTICAMDLFLGVPSTKLDTQGQERRKLYGKPGAFRYKPYGVEYRTLSNFWVFDDSLIRWAYEGTRRALEFVASGNKISQEDGELIQRAINHNCEESYAKLAKAYSL
jgi:hypothetical protein